MLCPTTAKPIIRRGTRKENGKAGKQYLHIIRVRVSVRGRPTLWRPDSTRIDEAINVYPCLYTSCFRHLTPIHSWRREGHCNERGRALASAGHPSEGGLQPHASGEQRCHQLHRRGRSVPPRIHQRLGLDKKIRSDAEECTCRYDTTAMALMFCSIHMPTLHIH